MTWMLWLPVIVVVAMSGAGILWLYDFSGETLYYFLLEWQSGISALLGLVIIALVETVRVAAEIIRHRQLEKTHYAVLIQHAIIAAEILHEQANLRVMDLNGLAGDINAKAEPLTVSKSRQDALLIPEPVAITDATTNLLGVKFSVLMQMKNILTDWHEYNRLITIQLAQDRFVTLKTIQIARKSAENLSKAAEAYGDLCRQQRDLWRPPTKRAWVKRAFRWFCKILHKSK